MSSIRSISRLAGAFLILCFSLAASAQDLDKRISLSVKNKALGEVLEDISSKAGILFSYSPQQIPVTKKISLSVKNEPVKNILDKLLTPYGIKFFISENQVILKPDQVVEPKPKDFQDKKKFTLSGYIRDGSTGEVLIGVNVYDKKSWLGTTSNSYGFFSLTLPEGEYQVAFSLIGYQPEIREIILTGNSRIMVDLRETQINMPEVEILSNPDEENTRKSDPGTVRLSNSTLKQMPGFAGNIDVIKSLHSVPGINSFGDGSTFYFVRGGNSDQNLLLIDDAPIYNPSHLFGFFSALAPDAIKDVKAYKGDFPASFGGRLSSVIDVRSRDGNMKRLGFSGNLGPFTSDFTFEGPFKKEISSFILSIRKSNLNWLTFTSKENRTVSIDFYDVNAKVNVRLNENNRLFLTAYNGNDDFRRINTGSNTFGIQWKNATGTLRWNHIYNSRLFSNTTASFSRYDYFLFISREQNNYWTSAISNGTLKTDFTWFMNPQNTIKAGVQLSSHYSNPGNVHISDAAVQQFIPEIPQYHSAEFCFYLSNEQDIGSRVNLNYGLRLTSWQDLGPTRVYLYDGTYKMIYNTTVASGTVYESFIKPEPRVNLSYAISNSSSLKLGYSHTAQFLQMLSNSISPFTSLEVWAPSGPTIRPQQADQVSMGWLMNKGKKKYSISIEGYYKWLNNQIEYSDHANMLYNPLIEGELRFGSIKAYGLEAMVRKAEGRFTGWLGYAYSSVSRTTVDVNHNNPYPASYERPNSFCFNLNYRSGKHWEFAANWIYLSGSTITTPTSFIKLNGYTLPVYGEKNNDRLPAYHRLDVTVTCWLNRPDNRFKHSLVLSIYNLYGRNNPYSVNFNKIMDDDGKFYIPMNLDGEYEIVASKISVAGVIPSLNYTFRF